ncbi:MAG: Eco57I restriction-modification methylase domain-containing protein [Ignavibacteriales bacterium]|nr:Eco57I restriction-modification methylase domain-containing protein [Ignavibacteriales bacterium]
MFSEEEPSRYAYKLSLEAAKRNAPLARRLLGQYFTPYDTALGMSSKGSFDDETIDYVFVLDPGAGTGLLACLMVEQIAQWYPDIAIHLVCYEIDPAIFPYLQKSIEYLDKYINEIYSPFSYELRNTDFILKQAHLFDKSLPSKDKCNTKYHYIIANPPFFKLNEEDPRYPRAKKICSGQPNIYQLFLHAAAAMLARDGQMIFLIPRSFCSGGRFAEFRRRLLKKIQINEIELYAANTIDFGEDCLAHESVIIKASRKKSSVEEYAIFYSFVSGTKEKDIAAYQIQYNEKQNLLPMPQSAEDIAMLKSKKNPGQKLKKLGLEIKAGGVLRSEVQPYLTFETFASGTAPVLWYNEGDTAGMLIKQGEEGKPDYLLNIPETQHLFIPNKNYVFLRRYSTGKTGNKFSAYPHLSKDYKSTHIAPDKKLCYIQKREGELTATDVKKICDILNSEAMNRYVHMLYGNINLSMEEMGELMNNE